MLHSHRFGNTFGVTIVYHLVILLASSVSTVPKDTNVCVTSGAGPWERSEAGGVNDDERHLHHSPVSSPHGGAPEG